MCIVVGYSAGNCTVYSAVAAQTPHKNQAYAYQQSANILHNFCRRRGLLNDERFKQTGVRCRTAFRICAFEARRTIDLTTYLRSKPSCAA
jgi:hypothetical protein